MYVHLLVNLHVLHWEKLKPNYCKYNDLISTQLDSENIQRGRININ